VGVQLWTFHNFDFLTAIAKADSAGAKFIEAFPGQKIGGTFKDAKFDHTLSAEGRTKIKELLASKGMTLMAFGVIVPQTREEWEKTFAFAKDMGIQFLTAEPKKEHWALADSLAGVNGIKIAIHDHPKPSPYWHPDSVLAAAAGHPNIHLAPQRHQRDECNRIRRYDRGHGRIEHPGHTGRNETTAI
jgi:sugar phosphate isomerase/epimerase